MLFRSPKLTVFPAYERQMAYVTAARNAAVSQRAALWKSLVTDPIDKACAMGGEYASLGTSTLTRPAADLDSLEAEVAAIRETDLTRVIGEAFDRANAQLRGPDTTICAIAAYPAATAITTDMHGVSALTAGAGKIWLTVHPGGSATLKDPGAYGLIVVQGSGTVGKLAVDSPNFIRFGEVTQDEVFVTAKRAGEGVTFKNSGSEPFVSLRYFGPDTHADLPKVGDHLKGGK